MKKTYKILRFLKLLIATLKFLKTLIRILIVLGRLKDCIGEPTKFLEFSLIRPSNCVVLESKKEKKTENINEKEKKATHSARARGPNKKEKEELGSLLPKQICYILFLPKTEI